MTEKFDRKAYTIKWIPIKDLVIAWPEAQRERFSVNKVAAIADNFDPKMIGNLIVCPVGNGKHHVIDGKHRRDAAEQVLDETYALPCMVFDVKDAAEAARIFDLYNGNRTAVSALDRFRTRATAGETVEVAVNAIVAGLGYRITAKPARNGIMAVGALLSVYRSLGGDTLHQALLLITETWPDDQNALAGPLIGGFAAFYAECGRQMDRHRLISRVCSRFTPGRLLGAGKTMNEVRRKGVSDAIKHVLINTYNENLRGKKLSASEGGDTRPPLFNGTAKDARPSA